MTTPPQCRAHGEAVQRAAVHAGRGGHRARARLRRHVRRQPHRLGGAKHAAGSSGTKASRSSSSRRTPTTTVAEAPPNIQRARVGGVHGRGRLACGGEVRTGRRRIHLRRRSFAAQQPSGYDLLNCASVDSRWHLAAVAGDSGGRHENRRRRAKRRLAGNDVTTCDSKGLFAAYQLRRRPRQDDRQRAERLRHRGSYSAWARRHAVQYSARHEALHRCREGEEAARRRRLDGRCADGIREKGRHALLRVQLHLYYSAGDTGVRQGIAEESPTR